MTRQGGRAILFLAVVLAVMLSGCARGAASQRPSATATSALSPTASAAQVAPTAQGGSQACKPDPGATAFGGLAVSPPSVSYGFGDDYMLPAGLPTQPLTVTVQDNGVFVQGAPLQSRPVVQEDAFIETFCNTSATHTYHLTGFGVRLTSLTSYADSLNAMNACAFLYGRPSGWGGECASGFSPDAELSFTFPAGAAPPLVVTQTPQAPLTLAPGQSLSVSFGANLTVSQVIADFQLGFAVDGGAVTYPATLRTLPVVIAPIARRWAGDFCRTTQMQALIPTTIPANTYYVCPKM